ncbi:Psychimicin [Eumeta japonica]|uniref:Psychimicin n=1 Tax=Eumeta variegata TaxID=151549 RepID=A0A4C1Y949_EUMVA|nr:Psychimicin [Eumeta japonica]
MNKTLVLLLVLAMAASSIDAINNWVRVPPCDQVCSRTNPEKDECCRAHGHAFHATCSGGPRHQVKCIVLDIPKLRRFLVISLKFRYPPPGQRDEAKLLYCHPDYMLLQSSK